MVQCNRQPRNVRVETFVLWGMSNAFDVLEISCKSGGACFTRMKKWPSITPNGRDSTTGHPDIYCALYGPRGKNGVE